MLELIHNNFCEFEWILTHGGNGYFIIVIDDISKYTYIYLLKNKSDAFVKFKVFLQEVENQLGKKKCKRLKNDRGQKYDSITFNSFIQSLRIIHETTPLYSPASNDTVERKK